MGDPRQMWEQFQKNMQRVQQSGARYAPIKSGKFDDGKTKPGTDLAEPAVVRLHHEERSVVWPVCWPSAVAYGCSTTPSSTVSLFCLACGRLTNTNDAQSTVVIAQ